MARIRTIKPDFFTSGTVAECSSNARLLFIGTWVFADDHGGLDRSAKQLKGQIFPHDDLDCEALVQELLHAGLLIEYQASGKKYLHIKNFSVHQKIDRPSQPRVPLYDESSSIPTSNTERSPKTRRALDALLLEGKGMEGNGREGSGSYARAHAERGLDEGSRVDETTEAEWRREAHEAQDRIQQIYPAGSNNSNWTVAMHHANCLVSHGFATWAELVDAVERYRTYQDAHATAMNIAAHNFFDPRKDHWKQPWNPKSDADLRLRSNVEAAREVFDNLPE